MNVNKDNCHLLISGSQNITINVDGNIIGKSICEKLLGVNINYKLNFNEHLLRQYFKKAGQKVNALSRTLLYMSFEKKLCINELDFYVTISLLPFSMDVSQPHIEY